jgi:hypothetical protein
VAGGHHHEIETAARQLRAAVNALPAGPQKTAMREASEQMIDALRDAFYTLRDGHELPHITNARTGAAA